MRSQQFQEGQRSALKRVIEWLHRRAESMNDPNAKAILNSAAFQLGLIKEGFLRKSEEKDNG